MTRLALPALATLALLLAASLAVELVGATPPPAVTAARVAPIAATGAEPDRSADWVATILARPLFSPNRRPAAVAAAKPGPAAAAGLPRLSGVMVTPAGRRAIFAGTSGGRPVTLAEGERIGGFVVSRIDSGSVFLTGPDGGHVLTPSFASGAEAAAIAPSAIDNRQQIMGLTPSGLDILRSLPPPPPNPIPAAPRP